MTAPTVDDVHLKFGQAAEAGQLLEMELGSLLFEHDGVELGLFAGDKPELAAVIIDRIRRSTLGQLLRKLGQKMDVPAQLDEVLATALAERNRLIHSFFREHNFRRNSPEGRAIMLEDLSGIHTKLIAGWKVALTISGIDWEAIMKSELPLPTDHVRI